MKKEKEFELFLKKMEDCEGCEMRNYGMPVFSGNILQEMMIIGYEPESHNLSVDSKLIAKASSLLSLYETEVKYGAYITYIYRCSLIIHGDLTPNAKQRCMNYLKEEIALVDPKYIIVYDDRVLRELFDNPDEILKAGEYPVDANLFGKPVKLYFIV